MKISQMSKLRHQDGRGKHEPAANLEKYNREGNGDGCPKWVVGREARLGSQQGQHARIFTACLGTGYEGRVVFKVRSS